jgi:ubiquitin carboxyl-terminal hydrolase 8
MELRSNKKIIGCIGLANLGNTCFLNSCIQVLCHTKELTTILQSNKIKKIIKKELPESEILYSWKDLQDIMYNNNGIVSPINFVRSIHKLASIKNREIFTGWAQNDMPEFLLFMIECIHNSISRGMNINILGEIKNKKDVIANECYKMIKTTYTKEYSEVMELFYGIYISQINSIDGSITHACKPESFFILDLPIPIQIPNPSIYDCFNLYCQPEILENENAWYNEKTKQKENVQKKLSFWSLPNILVITLKRFSFNGQDKLDTLVDFPIKNLDLCKFVDGYDSQSYKYDLYGVCNHIGSPLGGHYTAFVYNENNQWLYCNDTNVNILENLNQIISPMSYCLFYRKKNN